MRKIKKLRMGFHPDHCIIWVVMENSMNRELVVYDRQLWGK